MEISKLVRLFSQDNDKKGLGMYLSANSLGSVNSSEQNKTKDGVTESESTKETLESSEKIINEPCTPSDLYLMETKIHLIQPPGRKNNIPVFLPVLMSLTTRPSSY